MRKFSTQLIYAFENTQERTRDSKEVTQETDKMDTQAETTYESNQKITATSVGQNSKVEILEFETLRGQSPRTNLQQLHYLKQLGHRLRQIKIQINNGEVYCESGALQYMKGI